MFETQKQKFTELINRFGFMKIGLTALVLAVFVITGIYSHTSQSPLVAQDTALFSADVFLINGGTPLTNTEKQALDPTCVGIVVTEPIPIPGMITATRNLSEKAVFLPGEAEDLREGNISTGETQMKQLSKKNKVGYRWDGVNTQAIFSTAKTDTAFWRCYLRNRTYISRIFNNIEFAKIIPTIPNVKIKVIDTHNVTGVGKTADIDVYIPIDKNATTYPYVNFSVYISESQTFDKTISPYSLASYVIHNGQYVVRINSVPAEKTQYFAVVAENNLEMSVGVDAKTVVSFNPQSKTTITTPAFNLNTNKLYSAFTATASIDFASADVGKTGSVYIYAQIPDKNIYSYQGAGLPWKLLTPTLAATPIVLTETTPALKTEDAYLQAQSIELPAYLDIPLVDAPGVSFNNLIGTTVYIGYKVDSDTTSKGKMFGTEGTCGTGEHPEGASCVSNTRDCLSGKGTETWTPNASSSGLSGADNWTCVLNTTPGKPTLIWSKSAATASEDVTATISSIADCELALQIQKDSADWVDLPAEWSACSAASRTLTGRYTANTTWKVRYKAAPSVVSNPATLNICGAIAGSQCVDVSNLTKPKIIWEKRLSDGVTWQPVGSGEAVQNGDTVRGFIVGDCNQIVQVQWTGGWDDVTSSGWSACVKNTWTQNAITLNGVPPALYTEYVRYKRATETESETTKSDPYNVTITCKSGEQSNGQTPPACVAATIACPTGQYPDGATCSSSPKPCGTLPANAATFTKTWSGTTWGACAVTCNSGSLPDAARTSCVANTPAPTCQGSWSTISVTVGGSSTITWSSQNAHSARTSCTGPVSVTDQDVAVSGSGPITFPSAGTESCSLTVYSGQNHTGATGTCSTPSLTITAPVVVTPTCQGSWSTTSVTVGGSSTITWSSQNAHSARTSCTGPVTVTNQDVAVSGSGPITFPSAGTESCSLTVYSGQNHTGATGTCSTPNVIVNAPNCSFDSTSYLNAQGNDDLLRAAVDGKTHFCNSGRTENRCLNSSCTCRSSDVNARTICGF